jgi:hypothetical protein
VTSGFNALRFAFITLSGDFYRQFKVLGLSDFFFLSFIYVGWLMFLSFCMD